MHGLQVIKKLNQKLAGSKFAKGQKVLLNVTGDPMSPREVEVTHNDPTSDRLTAGGIQFLKHDGRSVGHIYPASIKAVERGASSASVEYRRGRHITGSNLGSAMGQPA